MKSFRKSVSIMISSILLLIFVISIGVFFSHWILNYTKDVGKKISNEKMRSQQYDYHEYTPETCLRAHLKVLRTKFPYYVSSFISEDFLNTNKISSYQNITVNTTIGKIYLAKDTSSSVYKQEININNSLNSNNLIDYQIIVNLSYHPAMYTNFSDIRFYYLNRSDNKEYKIPYYLRQKQDGSWAEFIVKVPYIQGNYDNETIYAYFGNKSLGYSESSYYSTVEIPPISWWNYTENPSSGSDYYYIPAIEKSIAIDHEGNYVIVGYYDVSGSGDYAWRIIKLYPNGTKIWTYTENPSSGDDRATSIAIDQEDNYVIAGWDYSPGSKQWRIIKLYPNGTKIWTYTEDPSSSGDVPWSIAIDRNQNYIIAGNDNSPGDYQWRIIKLYPNGTKIWTYTENPSSGTDYCYSVAVDKENNYIIAGQDASPGYEEIKVIKLYPNGTRAWNYVEDPSSYDDLAHSVRVDKDNNYIVAGADRSLGSTDPQWRIIKLYPNGTKIWTYTENPSSGQDPAISLAISDDNTYIITGWDYSPGDYQWRIIKLYPNGTKIWTYTENPSSGTDYCYSVAVDKENNYIVVGMDNSSGDYQWRIIKISERKYTNPEPSLNIKTPSIYSQTILFYLTGILLTKNLLTFNSTPVSILKVIAFNIDKYSNLINIYISDDNTTYKKINLDTSNTYTFTSQEQSWKSLFIKLILNSTADQSDTPVIDSYVIRYDYIPQENISSTILNPSPLNLTVTSVILKDKNTGEYCQGEYSPYYIEPQHILRVKFKDCSLSCTGDNLELDVATECQVFRFDVDC